MPIVPIKGKTLSEAGTEPYLRNWVWDQDWHEWLTKSGTPFRIYVRPVSHEFFSRIPENIRHSKVPMCYYKFFVGFDSYSDAVKFKIICNPKLHHTP